MANNSLDTNPLYNNIATAAQDVKAAYTGLPTFQSNMQASLVGPDAGLNSALGGYTDKVAELFAHDQQIAQNWSTSQVPSTIQPEGFMEDPYSKAMASSALYAQKGKETASALNLYETRKNYLGDLVDKAVKVYEAGIKGKEIDYQAAKDEFDNSLKLMQLAETKRSNLAQEGLAAGDSSTGDNMVDSMTDAEAIALANKLGYNFTGGTKGERIAKIRGALAEYNQTGQFNYRYLTENLPTKITDGVGALADVITRSNVLTATLKSGKNLTGPLIGPSSGFLSKYLGVAGEASMAGKELEEMSADKIKERYGGALTTTEVSRLTKQAITQRNVQESDNLQSLAIMKKNAENLIREKLRASGWSDKQIEGYITQLTTTESTGLGEGDWE